MDASRVYKRRYPQCQVIPIPDMYPLCRKWDNHGSFSRLHLCVSPSKYHNTNTSLRRPRSISTGLKKPRPWPEGGILQSATSIYKLAKDRRRRIQHKKTKDWYLETRGRKLMPWTRNFLNKLDTGGGRGGQVSIVADEHPGSYLLQTMPRSAEDKESWIRDRRLHRYPATLLLRLLLRARGPDIFWARGIGCGIIWDRHLHMYIHGIYCTYIHMISNGVHKPRNTKDWIFIY